MIRFSSRHLSYNLVHLCLCSAAIQIAQWLELERENLVRQLNSLRLVKDSTYKLSNSLRLVKDSIYKMLKVEENNL